MEKEDEFFDKIINILKKGAQERGAKEDIVITNTPLEQIICTYIE